MFRRIKTNGRIKKEINLILQQIIENLELSSSQSLVDFNLKIILPKKSHHNFRYLLVSTMHFREKNMHRKTSMWIKGEVRRRKLQQVLYYILLLLCACTSEHRAYSGNLLKMHQVT